MSGYDAEAFNAFEAAGWELRAEAYDSFASRVTGRVRDPLLDAVGLRRGERLLDVAAGPGHLSAAAAGRGAAVVGVDLSSAMVRLAQRLHPTLDFRAGNAEALPLEDDTFDALVGNFVILHVGRPERAASEFARVLRPGGRIALSTWDLPSQARWLGVLIEAVAAANPDPSPDIPAGPDFFRFSSEAEFATLLTHAGFTEPTVETVRFTHAVDSADQLWTGLLEGSVRIGALVREQDSDTQAKIRDEFDRLVSELGRDGTILLPVSVKIASATLPTN